MRSPGKSKGAAWSHGPRCITSFTLLMVTAILCLAWINLLHSSGIHAGLPLHAPETLTVSAPPRKPVQPPSNNYWVYHGVFGSADESPRCKHAKICDGPYVSATCGVGGLGCLRSAQQRQAAIKKAMQESWNAYRQYAWGHDELYILQDDFYSYRDWQEQGLSIVDSMTTLLLMNLTDEYQEARDWVVLPGQLLHTQRTISVFENNIRVVGGLLSAYALSGSTDGALLKKAQQVADRLLLAFDTSTGVPDAQYVPASTRRDDDDAYSYRLNSLAAAGTFSLELTTLSHLTGNSVYADANAKLWGSLSQLPNCDGLYCTWFDTDKMTCQESWRGWELSMSANADSFYEYLLKQWILTGKVEQDMLEHYRAAMVGVRKHLVMSVTPCSSSEDDNSPGASSPSSNSVPDNTGASTSSSSNHAATGNHAGGSSSSSSSSSTGIAVDGADLTGSATHTGIHKRVAAGRDPGSSSNIRTGIDAGRDSQGVWDNNGRNDTGGGDSVVRSNGIWWGDGQVDGSDGDGGGGRKGKAGSSINQLDSQTPAIQQALPMAQALPGVLSKLTEKDLRRSTWDEPFWVVGVGSHSRWYNTECTAHYPKSPSPMVITAEPLTGAVQQAGAGLPAGGGQLGPVGAQDADKILQVPGTGSALRGGSASASTHRALLSAQYMATEAMLQKAARNAGRQLQQEAVTGLDTLQPASAVQLNRKITVGVQDSMAASMGAGLTGVGKMEMVDLVARTTVAPTNLFSATAAVQTGKTDPARVAKPASPVVTQAAAMPTGSTASTVGDAAKQPPTMARPAQQGNGAQLVSTGTAASVVQAAGGDYAKPAPRVDADPPRLTSATEPGVGAEVIKPASTTAGALDVKSASSAATGVDANPTKPTSKVHYASPTKRMGPILAAEVADQGNADKQADAGQQNGGWDDGVTTYTVDGQLATSKAQAQGTADLDTYALRQVEAVTTERKLHHLACFLPGLLALGHMHKVDSRVHQPPGPWAPNRAREDGRPPDAQTDDDLLLAAKLMRGCYELYRNSVTGVAGEELSWVQMQKPGEATCHAPMYDSANSFLRPEVVESLFYLWRATHDPVYREWGWQIFRAHYQYSRLPSGGYVGLQAATNIYFRYGHQQESFWLAETLKYMYLLFSDDPHLVPLDEWVFNTEAHPLPVWT